MPDQPPPLPSAPPPLPRETGTAPTKSPRFHALDSLRAVAMLLGVYLHAAISFMTLNIPDWAAQDVRRHELFDLSVAVIHGFRMQLFFLLAGFFGHLLGERLGREGFIAHRAKRVGLPFVLGLVTISPLVGLAWSLGKGWLAMFFSGGFVVFVFVPAHLWFLCYLCILYGGAAGLGALLSKPGAAGLSAALDRAFVALAGKLWKPFLLAVPAVLLLLTSRQWGEIEAMPGRTLLPSPRALLYYGMFFGFGWFLHRHVGLLDSIKRQAFFHVALAAPFFLMHIGALVSQGSVPRASLPALKLLCCTGAALYAWFATFGVMGLFLRFADVSRPWIRYLSDSAYWVYLAHLPVVVMLQVAIAKWPMNVFVKFALLMTAALAVLYASYHWLVRYTPIGTLLNGPRKRNTGDMVTR